MGITQQSAAARLVQPGVCTSSTRPASPFEGQAIFETDTDRMLIWNGTAWVIPNAPAQNPTGLELVESRTVTNIGEVILENCFSATYRDYQVIVDITNGTANQEMNMQFRAGGVTASSAAYHFAQFGTVANGTASNTTTGSAAQQIPITFIPATQQNSTNYFIGQPFLTGFTMFSGDWLYDDGGTYIGRRTIGRHRVSASYTGLRISTANAWTGAVSVYGYRNS
jgi:hypothetical protein